MLQSDCFKSVFKRRHYLTNEIRIVKAMVDPVERMAVRVGQRMNIEIDKFEF